MLKLSQVRSPSGAQVTFGTRVGATTGTGDTATTTFGVTAVGSVTAAGSTMVVPVTTVGSTMVVPVTTVGSAGLVTTVVPVTTVAPAAPAAIAKTTVSAGDGRGGPTTGASVRHAPERARPVSAS
jgi:hypothetical protein